MSDGTASNDALPRGTVLRGYSIRQVLGQGGFGIVYRARHIELGNVVAIKEYLPAELAVRVGSSVRPRSAAYEEFYQDGLRRFRKEGQALVALHDQSGIVSCRDFFRRNNTAYLVMEFEAGMPLSQVLRERESEGRPFSEEDLMEVAVPLLEGLGHVHAAGMVHRDIKPSNLLLREANGAPVLIDFGAAKLDVVGQTKSMAPRTPGYAAWEQIVPDGELGPWTDIYAIGVLLWRIVAGGSPSSERSSPVPVERRMDAVVRGESEPMSTATELGEGRFNPEVLAAIDSCLKLRYDDRIQNCTELLGLLRLEGGSQYDVAMRIYRRIPGYHSRNKDSRSEESDYSGIRTSPLLPEVVKWLSLATAKDHAAAQYELAFLHHHGIGASHNPSLARNLLHRSADSGHFDAQSSIAFLYGFAFLHSRYEYRSNSEVARVCAMYFLNRVISKYCYRIYPTNDDYTDPNIPNLAVRWNCMCNISDLNLIYEDPSNRFVRIDGITHDMVSHLRRRVIPKVCTVDNWSLAEKAVTNPQPFEETQYEIGRIFEVGDRVPQDRQEAVRWYRMVAECSRVARIDGGWSGPIWTTNQLEVCKSADLRLRVLARADIDEARDYCWKMYKLGRIVPENIKDAFNWIQFGAAHGDAEAQYHLAWMYWNGSGVSRNDSESIYWFRTAARSGNPHAQNSLGVSYFFGRGVVQCYAKAQAWFLLSATNYGIKERGFMDTRNLEDVPPARYEKDLHRGLRRSVAMCRLLICVTTDHVMRGAIEWEDQFSRDCFLSAYNRLAKEKEENGKDFERYVDAEKWGTFQFNPTSEFFLGDSTLSFVYRSQLDPNQCELDSMSAFRVHPWDSGCLRAVCNFAISRFVQIHSAKYIDPGSVQPQSWFLSVMSWLSDHDYPLARFIRSTCIASANPHDAFSELCLAADQNHLGSQVILSMMYAMSEGIDLDSGLVEERLFDLVKRKSWIDATRKFGPDGQSRESLSVYLTRSFTLYYSSRSRENRHPFQLRVEQSNFDLGSWGIREIDVSICRLFPNKWYELFPLFHSGTYSDTILDVLRSYVRNKLQDNSLLRGRESGFRPTPDHLREFMSDANRRNEPDARALRKIRLAAFQGDSDAQFSFGALYASGDGVAVHYELAVDFLRVAGMGGNMHACFVLGILYEHGHGVARDDQESHYWYNRSQELGVKRSDNRISEDWDSIYMAGFKGEIVGVYPNTHDRVRYLFSRDQARTPWSWTVQRWRRWFASKLGCRLSQRWRTADRWLPSWDD